MVSHTNMFRRLNALDKSHSTALAHHFEDMSQQREASSLGMWAFLVTEVMFFGAVFAAYAVCRTMYPAAFGESSNKLNVVLGATNTAVLICSSLTMALAVRSAQLDRSKPLVGFLLATIILGAAFLGIKYVEYSHKFHEHLIPGNSFSFEGMHAPQAEIFFSFYFVMTGLHALHMIIGLGIMIWLVNKSRQGKYSGEYYAPVEMAGLYWHFVDIVWIFLFPLVYLIGRA